MNRNEYFKLEHFNLIIICNSNVVTMMMNAYLHISTVSGHKSPFGMVKHQIQLWFSFNNFCDVPKVANHQKKNLPKFWVHTRYESEKKEWKSF
jgi:hypothetical protein